MAKQVLDLYELFNLVVGRGGLVEVINKKQWQEIIKGLGLPSSITSAAFTLRTQYTKYLYPYEIHTKGLSNPDDLQNAIDGNKREGRRIEPYPMSGMPTSQMSPMGLPPHLSHSLHSPPRGHGQSPMSPGAQHQEQMQALEMTRLALFKLYNQGQPGMTGLPPLMPNLPNLDLFGANQKEALNLHIAQEKELQEKQRKEEEREEQRKREKQLQERLVADQMREKERELKERLAELDRDRDQSTPPPAKRQRENEETAQESPNKSFSSLPRNSTNISMSTRQDEDGRTSMEISLEINGITYSGVLFARPS